ncbi:MAG: hypothetical protein ACIALR_16955 [Blastopirellula sp. JB062]
MMNSIWKVLSPALLGGAILFGTTALTSGCDQKEKMLDVETPQGEVEVERDRETGDVDVEVNRDQ